MSDRTKTTSAQQRKDKCAKRAAQLMAKICLSKEGVIGAIRDGARTPPCTKAWCELAHVLYLSAKEALEHHEEMETKNDDSLATVKSLDFPALYERLCPSDDDDDDNDVEDAQMRQFMSRYDVCALAYCQFYELTCVVLKANDPFGLTVSPNLAEVLSTPLQLVSMVVGGHDQGKLVSKLFKSVDGLAQYALRVAPFIYSAVSFVEKSDSVHGPLVGSFLTNHKWHWAVAPIGNDEFTPVMFDVLPLTTAHRLHLPDLRSDMVGRISFGEIALTGESNKQCKVAMPGRTIAPLIAIHKTLPAHVLLHRGVADAHKWYTCLCAYFGEQTFLMSDASAAVADLDEAMLASKVVWQGTFGGSWIRLLDDMVHHCLELSDIPFVHRWDMVSVFLIESIGPPFLASMIKSICEVLPTEPAPVQLPKFEEDARVVLAAALANVSLSDSNKTRRAREQAAKLAKAAATARLQNRFKPLTPQHESAMALVLMTNIIANVANLYVGKEVESQLVETLMTHPPLLQRLAIHKTRLLSAMFLYPDARSAVDFACQYECDDNRLLTMVMTLERYFKHLFDMDIATALVPVDVAGLPADAYLVEMLGTFTTNDETKLEQVIAYVLSKKSPSTVRENWRKHLTPQAEAALSKVVK